MPSSAVGRDSKEESSDDTGVPTSNGVNFLGSNVSVCAMPPAMKSRMTVSAVAFAFLSELPKTRCGMPVAIAANEAAEMRWRKSRRVWICGFMSADELKLWQQHERP